MPIHPRKQEITRFQFCTFFVSGEWAMAAFPVHIRCGESHVTLDVSPELTVWELKQLVSSSVSYERAPIYSFNDATFFFFSLRKLGISRRSRHRKADPDDLYGRFCAFRTMRGSHRNKGQLMQDTRTLSSYNVTPRATIHCVLSEPPSAPPRQVFFSPLPPSHLSSNPIRVLGGTSRCIWRLGTIVDSSGSLCQYSMALLFYCGFRVFQWAGGGDANTPHLCSCFLDVCYDTRSTSSEVM
jgi:hypothetical protein